MSTKHILSGIGINIIIKFASIALGILTTRWLVVNASINEYEIFNLSTAYIAMIIPFISWGIPALIQKAYTHYTDVAILSRYWTTYMTIRVGSFFVGLVLVLLTQSLAQTNNFLIIFLIYITQFILITDLSYRTVCDARGKSWQYSLSDLIARVAFVTLLYLSLWTHFSNILLVYVLATIISNAIGLIIDFFVQRKVTPISAFDVQILKDNYKPILYLTVSAIILAFYLNTDKLFLKYFGESAIGINSYFNAYKLFDVILVIPGLSIPVIASVVIKKIKQNQLSFIGYKIASKFKIKPLHNQNIIISEWLIIACAIATFSYIGVSLLGKHLILIIDPQLKYPDSIPILYILALAIFPVSVGQFFGVLNIFNNGELYEFYTSIIVGIITILSYITFISWFGTTGAAVSTLICFSVDCLLKIYFFFKLKKSSARV